MNPTEINKRIAISCGWKHLGKTFAKGVLYYDAWESQEGTLYTYPPNYHGDLNAMHEAEKTLDRGENHLMRGGFGLYLINLPRVCDGEPRVCATAAQRAEAFLRTLGKWEDGE